MRIYFGESHPQVSPGVIEGIPRSATIILKREPEFAKKDPSLWPQDLMEKLGIHSYRSAEWSQTTVGGLPARKMLSQGAMCNVLNVLLTKEELIFLFTANLCEEENPIFNQILSSFKLLNDRAEGLP